MFVCSRAESALFVESDGGGEIVAPACVWDEKEGSHIHRHRSRLPSIFRGVRRDIAVKRVACAGGSFSRECQVVRVLVAARFYIIFIDNNNNNTVDRAIVLSVAAVVVIVTVIPIVFIIILRRLML